MGVGRINGGGGVTRISGRTRVLLCELMNE